MRLDVNGTVLEVEDEGNGQPVLLLHGWPDSHEVWRHQITALGEAGYRTIAPDLRGFGQSDKPDTVASNGLLQQIGDLIGLLDLLEVPQANVVGHDWGGAIGAMLAALSPERVTSLTCVSVGHPAAFAAAGWEQREKSWYMLLFQFPGIAERWLLPTTSPICATGAGTRTSTPSSHTFVTPRPSPRVSLSTGRSCRQNH